MSASNRGRRPLEWAVLDESQYVELDPSIADWLPDCWSCGEQIASWAEAVALPATTTGIEDDEPNCLMMVHRECPLARSVQNYREAHRGL